MSPTAQNALKGFSIDLELGGTNSEEIAVAKFRFIGGTLQLAGMRG